MNAREQSKDWKSRRSTDEGIWIVSLMSDDLGFFDLEQKILLPLDNPFDPEVVTHVFRLDKVVGAGGDGGIRTHDRVSPITI